jgi:phosphopantetheinyl transferase (holo-ACP synthase)
MRILQGIDLLKVDRIEKIYLNYGESFLKKIFSDNEISQIKEKEKKKKLNINLLVSFLLKKQRQRPLVQVFLME